MTSQQYTVVGAIPQIVRPIGSTNSMMIQNTSTTNTVYLADFPNQNGFPLTPGSTIGWDTTKGLWLYTTTGATVIVNIVDNTGILTDASAIAAQIQISGAPPIDAQTVLLDTSYVDNGAGSAFSVIDVTKYQSIVIYVNINNGAAPGATPSSFAFANIYWTRNPTDNYIVTGSVATDAFICQDNNGDGINNGFTNYTVPVRTLGMTLSLAVTGVTPATVSVIIVGSYKTAITAKYMNHSAYLATLQFGMSGVVNGNDGAAIYSGTKTLGTAVYYPTTRSGNATFNCFCNTVTAQGSCNITDARTGTGMVSLQLPISAAQQNFSLPVVLPARPIRVTIAGVGVSWAVTLTNDLD